MIDLLQSLAIIALAIANVLQSKAIRSISGRR